jgi:hypothetical protein
MTIQHDRSAGPEEPADCSGGDAFPECIAERQRKSVIVVDLQVFSLWIDERDGTGLAMCQPKRPVDDQVQNFFVLTLCT